MLDKRNLTLDLIAHAQATPEAPALILSEREICYRELNDLTWQCAQYLHDQGVRAGQVVGVTCADEFTLALVILGLIRLGATSYSIPRSSTSMQRSEMAVRVRASILVTDDLERFDAGIPSVVVDRALLRDVAVTKLEILDQTPDAPWLLITGSGTTGEPKLLPVTHGQQRARNGIEVAGLQITAADRSYVFSHLDFSIAKHRMLIMLSVGASFGLVESDPTDDLLRLCEERRFTLLGATPFHAERMLARLSRDIPHKLSLRALVLSAATVSGGLRERVQKLLCPNLHVSYGSNESGGIARSEPPEVYTHPESVGTPLPGMEVEIVDRETLLPLPAETVGLIRVRSPGLIDGYLDNAQATRENFRDGWFFPGDLGKFTENGLLIHYGRADQMMIMNGINIYPAEIENVLMNHPAIRDAAVIPLKHRVHQDVPVCVVALFPDVKISEKELLEFALERLGTRSPRVVTILEEIPRNEQGKPIRKELAMRVAEKIDQSNMENSLHRNSPVEEASSILQDSGKAVDGGFIVNMNVTPDAPRSLARQPLHSMRLVMKCSGPVDITRLDENLTHVFNLDLEACKARPGLLALGDRAIIAELAWRGMLLGRELFQAGGLPAFDTGYVIAVEPGGEHSWHVHIAVPHIDHISIRCYQAAYGESIRIISALSQTTIRPDQVKSLRETVSQKVIATLRQESLSGQSTLHVLSGAHKADIPAFHLGGGVYQLGWGSRGRRVDRSSTEGDSAFAVRLTQNKLWTAMALRMAGLPAPLHGLANSAQEAVQLAGKLGWPVVVKPVDSDRGEGVSVGIHAEVPLKEAYERAKKASRSKQVIVECEVPGVCHRLFIANGRLLYAVKRLPISVTGDGVHSVAELIAIANRRESAKPSWQKPDHFPDDDLALAAMRTAGFDMDTVPRSGELVPLRTIESTADGGVDEDVSHYIHPDNLDAALRAAQLCGLEVAGVDMITPDISRSWSENGAIINELNYSPLLGGAAISKSHIPEFLRRVMGDSDGRIPVDVYVGGAATLAKARKRQAELVAGGRCCYLTSHTLTLNSRGEEMCLSSRGLYRRGLALLLNHQVDHVILVVQTDEIIRSGFPVDRVDHLIVDEGTLTEAGGDKPLSLDRTRQLVAYLKSLPKGAGLGGI